MRKLTVLAFAAGLLALGGCTFHHVRYADDSTRDYVAFDADPSNWGGHVYEYDEDN